MTWGLGRGGDAGGSLLQGAEQIRPEPHHAALAQRLEALAHQRERQHVAEEIRLERVERGVLQLAAENRAAIARDDELDLDRTIDKTAKNAGGPQLNGLDGRKSGTVADYSYSDANKKADITWGEAAFKDYIQNPMAKVPGTKMAFAGIKSETEIANLWAYLAQFKADGSKK